MQNELIFTDLDAARQWLDGLRSEVLSGAASLETQAEYHLSAGFWENQRNEYVLAERHYQAAIALLEKMAASAEHLADAWLDAAAVFANQQLWERAEQALQRAEKYLADAPSPRLSGRLAARKGYYCLHLGQNEQGLTHLMDAERLLLESSDNATLKDHFFHALTLAGLGELHGRMDEKEKSVEAFLQVLRICQRHDLRPRLGWHYLNGGRARLALDDVAGAAELFQSALFYAEKNDVALQSSAYANLGITAVSAGETAQAMSLLEEAGRLLESPATATDFHNLLVIEAWKARAYLNLGFLDEAEEHFEKAAQYGERGSDWQQLVEVCAAIAALRAERENFREAYEFQRRAAAYAARHAEQTRSREIREIEARHDLEKNRQEARLMRLRLTSLQLRALRTQMNPHFLFNALNAIQGFITSGKSDEAERYLARFAKFMRRTLDYSDREVVPLETEIEFLEKYLDINRRLRFQDNLHYLFHLPDDLDAGEVLVPTMLIQPFIENAIEHGLRPRMGGALHVSFEMTDDETCLLCTIEDDGVGYHESRARRAAGVSFSKHKSRGMDITRERLELLHAQQGRDEAGQPFMQIVDLGEKTGGARRGTRSEVLIPVLE